MNEHDPAVFPTAPLSPEVSFDLVRRMNLWRSLIRRQQEEYIASLVPFDSIWVNKACEEIQFTRLAHTLTLTYSPMMNGVQMFLDQKPLNF